MVVILRFPKFEENFKFKFNFKVNFKVASKVNLLLWAPNLQNQFLEKM